MIRMKSLVSFGAKCEVFGHPETVKKVYELIEAQNIKRNVPSMYAYNSRSEIYGIKNEYGEIVTESGDIARFTQSTGKTKTLTNPSKVALSALDVLKRITNDEFDTVKLTGTNVDWIDIDIPQGPQNEHYIKRRNIIENAAENPAAKFESGVVLIGRRESYSPEEIEEISRLAVGIPEKHILTAMKIKEEDNGKKQYWMILISRKMPDLPKYEICPHCNGCFESKSFVEILTELRELIRSYCT